MPEITDPGELDYLAALQNRRRLFNEFIFGAIVNKQRETDAEWIKRILAKDTEERMKKCPQY